MQRARDGAPPALHVVCWRFEQRCRCAWICGCCVRRPMLALAQRCCAGEPADGPCCAVAWRVGLHLCGSVRCGRRTRL